MPNQGTSHFHDGITAEFHYYLPCKIKFHYLGTYNIVFPQREHTKPLINMCNPSKSMDIGVFFFYNRKLCTELDLDLSATHCFVSHYLERATLCFIYTMSQPILYTKYITGPLFLCHCDDFTNVLNFGLGLT